MEFDPRFRQFKHDLKVIEITVLQSLGLELV